MTRFEDYLKQFDITRTLTDEDIQRTTSLLQIYGSVLRRATHNIEDMESECYESRRQSVSDFVNLAIDYDHDTDRKRIADRLASMGHSMQLLSIMEDALIMMKEDTASNSIYYDTHTAGPMRTPSSRSAFPPRPTTATSRRPSVSSPQNCGAWSSRTSSSVREIVRVR